MPVVSEADKYVHSTGGINALRLFVQNTPLEECVGDFKSLCSRAFVPRRLSGIPVLRDISTANHGSIYRTTPFEALLQALFGKDDVLFGKTDCEGGCFAKVAVTSTTRMESHKLHPVLVANYNRPNDQGSEKGTQVIPLPPLAASLQSRANVIIRSI